MDQQLALPTGNIVGVDPHKRTLSATLLDDRHQILAQSHFNVSGAGHRDLEAWALAFGPVVRWGVEGANGLGRHTAVFLTDRGHDVRDVCPTRTADHARKRRQGKSDTLDSERIARETATHADLPPAFKRASGDAGVDENHDLMALWHTTRRSLAKVRAQLLNEAAALLHQLPEDVRDGLGGSRLVQPQLNALAKRLPRLRRRQWDAATALRLRLLAEHIKMIAELRRRDAEAAQELRSLLEARRSTLTELPGLAERSAAELLVEVGDARRFTSGGFARFNGTAPLPASSGEGSDQPVRHRYNPAGNRRVNAALHRMAITQLRCEPRARQLYTNARKAGHTKKEAMRILKRHLSNVVHRQMLRDLQTGAAASPT